VDTKSLLYLAICSKKSAPGVFRKIEGFVAGARACGYNGRAVIYSPGHWSSYLFFIAKLALAPEKHIIIRYIDKVGLAIFFGGLVLRLRRRNLYIDIPTPIRNHLREIAGKKDCKFRDAVEMLLIGMQGAIPFLSATRLIQYAPEGRWFSLGVAGKTVRIGNGIDVGSVPCRSSAPQWPAKTLNLVAVGTVGFWHGWDNVIEAMRLLRENHHANFAVKFTIIGEGPELRNLKRQAESSGLADNVRFLGMLYNDELYAQFADAHFGVGSLGWSRIGLKEASPLKAREYIAAGVPVIYATKDPDLENSEPIALRIKEEDVVFGLCSLLKKISESKFASAQECRRFAQNKLDFKVKISSIISA